MEFRVRNAGSETVGMVIKPTGNVGIGTTGPVGKLHIDNNGDHTYLYIDRDKAGSKTGQIRFISDGSTSDNFWRFGQLDATNDNLELSRRYSSTWSTVMGFDITSGNVGIGTTSPGEKLEVIGTISGSDIYTPGNIVVGGNVDGVDIAGMSAFVTANTTHRGADGSDHSNVADLWAASGSYLTAETDPIFLSLSGSIETYVPMSLSGNWNTDLTSGSAHFVDSSDPHGSVLTQTNIDLTSGSISTDNDASGSFVLRNILIGEEATPGPASLYPQGTIYMKYTA